MMAGDICAIHWVDTRTVRPQDGALLSSAERARVANLRQAVDRYRYVAATALLRRLVAAETGSDPSAVVVDRRCGRCGRQHGRPTLPGLDIHVSITHSGAFAGVALCRAGAVGLDIEKVTGQSVLGLRTLVLGAEERADDPIAFYRYWTRKEAVVKATGDGISAGLTDVLVSGPGGAPRLLAYPNRPGLHAALTDLEGIAGYVASVAVLTVDGVRVTESWDAPEARD